MRSMYQILLVMFVALSGVLVYIIVRQSRARVDYLPSEVSAESIAVYVRKADSLERIAEVMEMDLAAVSLLEQPGTRLRIMRLRDEIAALRTAAERWQVARTPAARNNAYRECILLYGRATGICDELEVDKPVPVQQQ